jgi:YHS domain-containing protein
MKFFSFNKKEKKLKCDWCGKEMDKPLYKKYIGKKTFYFCSQSCKQKFKESGKGKRIHRLCPTCAMSPKSWDSR